MSRNPKALSRRTQIDSTAFRAWFGESKVVAAEGGPAICTHYTDRVFEAFSAEEQKRAKAEGSGYTTPFGFNYGFPETGFFFFVEDAPPPVGKKTIAVQSYLSINNPLDLTQRISPEDTSRIIDFVKQRATLLPRPGHHGYTPRGDKLGGFRTARKVGVTAQQLWEFLNENLYARRGVVWDQMLAVLGKDGVIFEGNSSGTALLESERGLGDGKTYRIAVALKPAQIKSATCNSGDFDASNTNIRFSRIIGTPVDKTNSHAFREWFGDSKVVDKQGRPLVVYHGTDQTFTEFDTTPVNSADKKRLGSYFTANKRFAELYGGNVVEVYLSVRNPLCISGMDANTAINALPISTRLKQELRCAFRGDDYLQYALIETAQRENVRGALEAAGYDGVKFIEGYADTFVAFRSTQIRLATINDGIFDATNPDICMSQGLRERSR